MMTKNKQKTTTDPFHIPVMSRELIAGLNIVPGGHYLDATLGGGGHSQLILESYPDVRVTGIDQDAIAIATTTARLATLSGNLTDRIQFWQGNFANFQPGVQRFDGIIADLGVNSNQLDTPERGFSFRASAPLDMRMNQQQELTAAEIVNTWDQEQLADIFYHYGEERFSRRIARQIVQKRPFQTTTDLAEAVSRSVPPRYRYGRINPATRVFQGLRIRVNRELEVLETFLDIAPTWLKPGGRIGMISFHSLEDRIVKHRFKDNSILQILTKKPIQPAADEIAKNPRARSAKLRLAERAIASQKSASRG
ncbi:MAG: 16S rRNA (cytosine(1402)-N(4))-methyltransferase RsmH [Microcoleaceae cyanobacterium]